MNSDFHIEGNEATLDGQYHVAFLPKSEDDVPGITVVVFLDKDNRPTDQTNWTKEDVVRDFQKRWRDSKRHS